MITDEGTMNPGSLLWLSTQDKAAPCIKRSDIPPSSWTPDPCLAKITKQGNTACSKKNGVNVCSFSVVFNITFWLIQGEFPSVGVMF